MKSKWIIILGIFISLIFVSYITLFSNISNAQGLPKYALQNERVKEAYLFAKDNRAFLDGINCYCGCMNGTSEGRIHKDGLEDCFLKENGQFEIHGSSCTICLSEALEVKSLLAQNKTKEEIKKIIEEKYAKLFDYD